MLQARVTCCFHRKTLLKSFPRRVWPVTRDRVLVVTLAIKRKVLLYSLRDGLWRRLVALSSKIILIFFAVAVHCPGGQAEPGRGGETRGHQVHALALLVLYIYSTSRTVSQKTGKFSHIYWKLQCESINGLKKQPSCCMASLILWIGDFLFVFLVYTYIQFKVYRIPSLGKVRSQ